MRKWTGILLLAQTAVWLAAANVDAAPAASAKWVKVKSTPARTIYVDTSSIRVGGNFSDVWEKTVENVTKPKRVSVEIDRWRYDCAKRRATLLYSESHLKSGALVDSAGIPESQRIWDDIRPTSAAAASLKFACSR
jgi:hypothetical protein